MTSPRPSICTTGPCGDSRRQEALVRPRLAQPVELRAELLVEDGVHAGTPFGRRTILQASPRLEQRERLLEALERELGGDERAEVDDAVLEEPARRVPGLPDLAAVHRGHGEVLEDEGLRDVDRGGPRGDAEEDDVAAVPHDLERVLDRPQRAGHLEDDAHADALVLLGEPGRDVVDLVHVHDRPPRRASSRARCRNGTWSDAKQPARAERLRDRDREEPDRAAAEHGDRAAGEVLRATSRRPRCRTAPAGTRSRAGASCGRSARRPTPGTAT